MPSSDTTKKSSVNGLASGLASGLVNGPESGPANSLKSGQRRRGAVAVLAVILLPILIMVAAVAIDIANLMLVKNELQNAADSAAQAGAQCLYPRAECFNTTAQSPDWGTAESRASAAVQQNTAQGKPLISGLVASGYWNVTGTPHILQSLPMTPTANDAPAIQVTIAKRTGENSGSVVLYLAGLMGLSTADVSATAISVVTSTGSVSPGTLFPFAMAKCMYDSFWDTSTNQPKTASTTGPDAYGIPQVSGEPWVFRFGVSAEAYGGCEGGQYTSFALDDNSTTAVRKLIQNGNPTALAIGEQIWIEPGAKADLYKIVDGCSARGDKTCEYVTIPVAMNASYTLKGEQPIFAFGCMHMLLAEQGDKYVQVQMSTLCPPIGGGGTGPDYGVHNNPRLAM